MTPLERLLEKLAVEERRGMEHAGGRGAMRTTDWKPVSKRRPCLVCGKGDWCLFAGPDDAPEAAICARTESVRRIGEAGWLHRLRDNVTAWPRWASTFRRAEPLASGYAGPMGASCLSAADMRGSSSPRPWTPGAGC